MPYCVRGFCTSAKTPSLTLLARWLKSRDIPATIQPSSGQTLTRWTQATVTYAQDKPPIRMLCLPTATDAGRAEIDRFLPRINPAESDQAARVAAHLRAAEYVVVCELPPDMPDAGWDTKGQILAFLADKCGALLQADGEGFYDWGTLILPIK